MDSELEVRTWIASSNSRVIMDIQGTLIQSRQALPCMSIGLRMRYDRELLIILLSKMLSLRNDEYAAKGPLESKHFTSGLLGSFSFSSPTLVSH